MLDKCCIPRALVSLVAQADMNLLILYSPLHWDCRCETPCPGSRLFNPQPTCLTHIPFTGSELFEHQRTKALTVGQAECSVIPVCARERHMSVIHYISWEECWPRKEMTTS